MNIFYFNDCPIEAARDKPEWWSHA